MFIVALFTITRQQQKPKHSLTDEWIDKQNVVFYTHTHTHTHTGILLSFKKDGNFDTYHNMDKL